jgi:hypothetical protein
VDRSAPGAEDYLFRDARDCMKERLAIREKELEIPDLRCIDSRVADLCHTADVDERTNFICDVACLDEAARGFEVLN